MHTTYLYGPDKRAFMVKKNPDESVMVRAPRALAPP